MERKAEGCILNCVERFIDTSNYIVNRLEREGEANVRASTDAVQFGSESANVSSKSSPDEFKWH